MTQSMVVALARDALIMTVALIGPILLVSLVIGLVISMFQAATQINEMTLTFVPKIIAVGAVLVFAGPWMLQMIIAYTTELLSNLHQWVR
ncbi:MAG: flagellar biosynthesis protein FliQ [Chloroflexi bacterium]|nr:flagellar biosynthesis protein FliQ [Chloroflexota bacterium]